MLRPWGLFRRWSRRPALADPRETLAGIQPGAVRLVVGLGNPGGRYAGTRHNVGFWVADRLAERVGAAWQDDTRPTASLLAAARLDAGPVGMAAGAGTEAGRHWSTECSAEEPGARLRPMSTADGSAPTAASVAAARALVLAKPQTYMNVSGEAVAALVERLGVALYQVLVVYDDMDLPLGTIRLRERGSAGTHNGMRHIVATLGSHAVPRLRVGVGQAGPNDAREYVLGEFAVEEQPTADAAVGRAADAVLCWVHEGASTAMNRFNR